MSRLSEKLAIMTPRTRQYIMLGGAGTVPLEIVDGDAHLRQSPHARTLSHWRIPNQGLRIPGPDEKRL